jgi:hypothetical protein
MRFAVNIQDGKTISLTFNQWIRFCIYHNSPLNARSNTDGINADKNPLLPPHKGEVLDCRANGVS